MQVEKCGPRQDLVHLKSLVWGELNSNNYEDKGALRDLKTRDIARELGLKVTYIRSCAESKRIP